jgi:2-methylisocitrate lyase-like PEP mutase family enzyme
MTTMADRFRSMHESGIFVMPNPWDRGSAVTLQDMGFPALATTSAGLGRSIGKDDQEVTRDELLRHVADLTSVLEVPLNVDSERLFPDDPGGIPETVRLLADAGAAGCSIEDYSPSSESIDPLRVAREAVAIAAHACKQHGLVLTARAENHLYGRTDLDDTVARLSAFRDAGADVLYAPGLSDTASIRTIVEIGLPVNVLAMAMGPSVAALNVIGVRRVSTGSALFNATRTTLRAAATELRDLGTSTYAL